MNWHNKWVNRYVVCLNYCFIQRYPNSDLTQSKLICINSFILILGQNELKFNDSKTQVMDSLVKI